jgi:hypothetical protein
LIGDDSTMEKVRGKKMAGLGKHHSTTAGTRVVGHSLVQALYVVQGRHCPLSANFSTFPLEAYRHAILW